MGNKSNEEQAEASRQLVHELRVHQIELELQNEELRRTQAELATARARYFDLYDLAPVGYCTVSATEDILEANLTAASMLGLTCGELVSRAVQHFILPQASTPLLFGFLTSSLSASDIGMLRLMPLGGIGASNHLW